MEILQTIRNVSIAQANRFGIELPIHFPLLDFPGKTRSAKPTIRRLLCLHVVAACSYGFRHTEALDWVAQEDLRTDLTVEEVTYLTTGQGPIEYFRDGIESMWCLSWALSLVPTLDFTATCDDNFYMLMPDLRTQQSGASIRHNGRLRDMQELLQAADLAYCLHWATRHAALNGRHIAGLAPPYVIVARRHALEWLLSDQQWDAVSLDT